MHYNRPNIIQMPQKDDYTHYTFLTTLAVIVILSILSIIPPIHFDGFSLRRANIFSDVISFSADAVASTVEGEISSDDLLFNSELIAQETLMNQPLVVVSDSTLNEEWFFSDTVSLKESGNVYVDTNYAEMKGRVIPIEDFSVSPNENILELQKKLLFKSKKELVRIAFFGDSFIEADILTADVRETLQERFNGSGIGFVPFATPLTRYRNTVKHTHSGWESYNIMQKRKAPVHLQDKFYVSGVLSIPNEDAKVEYRGVKFRDHVDKCDGVRLLFINEGSTKIDVVINDSISHRFTPSSSAVVQQISLRGKDLSSLSITLSDVDGFIGYGAIFESNQGVGVDNYSVRSNSGSAIFGTSYSINRQMDDLLEYDAIVLQYGLNSMSQDIVRYGSYGKQYEKIIEYTRKCFPDTPIVILSVGDRSMAKDGEYVTMPGATAMIKEQNAVAKRSGVSFWNTYKSMALYGGMPSFVNNGWAAKDYTHIGYGGGAIIGRDFARALSAVSKESILEYTTACDSSLLEISNINKPIINFAVAPIHVSKIGRVPTVNIKRSRGFFR